MANKKENEVINTNPLLFRYPPNNRFISGEFKNQIECSSNYENFGDSITDKESYRLSLVGKAGAISSLTPNQNKGWYMFEDGVYDIHKDFSTIMRKDLSIVDIENYEKILKSQLEEADESLKFDIKSQLEQLNNKKEEIINNKPDNAQNSTTE